MKTLRDQACRPASWVLPRPRSARNLIAAWCLSVACSVCFAQTNSLVPPSDAVDEATGDNDWPHCDFGACPAPSRWSARAGAIFLQRTRPAAQPIVIDANSGATILNANNFVFPFQAGVDAGLMRRGDVVDVDVRYFGVNQWSASQPPVEAPQGSQIAVFGVVPSGGPSIVLASDVCSLQSFETNLRRNLGPRLSLLGGFRYVGFRDAMFLTAGDPTFTSGGTVTLGTRNNLLGLQLGTEAILWKPSDRFWCEGALKLGLYANAAHNSLNGHDLANPSDGVSLYLGHDHTAFVAEKSFSAVYQLSPHWLRGGYQLLWLSGVATGPRQLHNIDLSAGSITTNTSSDVFFQGALASLECRW